MLHFVDSTLQLANAFARLAAYEASSAERLPAGQAPRTLLGIKRLVIYKIID